jgi:DNA-directed RNA polymerase subunit RPC12/RpoP
MSDESPEALLYVRCTSCLHTFLAEHWNEDLACPECEARETRPAPVFEGAVEYSLAARATGPTIEDLRLARVLSWLGLVPPPLLQKLLHEQVRTAEEKGNALPLGDLLLREEALGSQQLHTILRCTRVDTVPTSWQRFGEYAFQAGLLTKEQLEECSAIQCDLVERGMEFPFIGHLMVEMGFCRQGQVQALLRSQRNKRKEGFLWEMEQELQGEGKQPAGRVKQAALADKGLRTNLLFAAAAVVLLCLTVIGWGPAEKNGATRFGAACPGCGFHEAEFSADPEDASCPKCEKDLLPCVVCVRCRALVTMTQAGAKRCPACRAAGFTRWRKGMRVGKLQKRLEE